MGDTICLEMMAMEGRFVHYVHKVEMIGR